MTNYELLRWLTFPVMTVHLQTVRRDVRHLVKSLKKTRRSVSILDVGGRKSPYTIGLSASITLLDVPQEQGTKQDLNLGFTESILKTIQKKRSNISDLIIQDMTTSTLTDASYDAVTCIEVIEHVPNDEDFVANISKVIKPGGWAYFTTPNGDFIKNEGPDRNMDHVRHYTKSELQSLLDRYFKKVEVRYAVKTGTYRVMGLKGIKASNPLGIIKTASANIINGFQSKGLENTSMETAHLIAVAYK
ncbi:bifunctional 2-polyprenyl-6-hydroxyphenol methylase/3-demethylubiquinol 3-O-methyltransferase UbiG [Sediminibacter sp. Hel_I_10]|uniref:class I SAM-dependent methyltransferase n=1 Tax=Sediminibacter sp. Hel_I_10 TaxID=1392490 RepID=UPI0018CC3DB9|nr:methyltransferase domain-containing protein [Sediminibacter sp. Hel_I_10]